MRPAIYGTFTGTLLIALMASRAIHLGGPTFWTLFTAGAGLATGLWASELWRRLGD